MVTIETLRKVDGSIRIERENRPHPVVRIVSEYYGGFGWAETYQEALDKAAAKLMKIGNEEYDGYLPTVDERGQPTGEIAVDEIRGAITVK